MMLALALAAVLGVTTLDGRPFDVWDDPSGPPATLVLVFVRPDCPVANRYVPELNRLYADYHARGIRMYVVYAAGENSREAIRAHYAEYGLRVPALVDPGLLLADAAGATVTPEAAVFVPPFPQQRPKTGDQRPELVYRGRIDDRAAGPGLWRAASASRDLDVVLARLARGEHVASFRTRAHGCYLKPLSH